MRNAARLVIVALTALLLALPAGVAGVSAGAETRADQSHAVAAQPAPTETSQPGTTTPDGPELTPAETEADKVDQRRKLVMGIASAVLLGIVVWGRSVRRKKAKAG
ncbi:hypothetical protein BLA60_39965 [Actinophytocola xinjiangensis]|uniref:MYXO-CTERM domain-containing protein n=1 Tax=Actinophytocola xinjiangensis TaxID=485602 RepID=A0A7Z0WD01_9PSEU|nr:hypothetical protein [Actinophytocola xinjiangensis]OLF04583.1 hypothetical protein BLA60_39965 [Actinophytocola xinjiangensis]